MIFNFSPKCQIELNESREIRFQIELDIDNFYFYFSNHCFNFETQKQGKKNEARLEELKISLKRNKWHQNNLNALLRKVDNEGVTMETFTDSCLADSIQFYLDSVEQNEEEYDDPTMLTQKRKFENR